MDSPFNGAAAGSAAEPTPAIAISGAVAAECVRALAAGLTAEQRLHLLALSLPLEVRVQAFKELLWECGTVTAEEGGAMVSWTEKGFARTATKENCAHIRLGHKQPTLYPIREVARMLMRLRIWPKGRPADAIQFSETYRPLEGSQAA